MSSKMYKGYLYAVLSAVIFGSMPLMAKYIYADGVSPMTLVFLRNLLALPSLAVLAWMQEKSFEVPIKALPSISLISLVGCCMTPVLLFSSYQFIASGTATVFHFIYPSIVVIGGIIFLKKKVLPGNLLCVAICAVGIALFYTPGQPLDPMGSALSLASGLTFATYVLLLSCFKYSKVSGFLFSFYVAASASVMTFIACLIFGELALPSSFGGWLFCFVFAFLVTTGAVVLFQQAAFIIGGERTSILSTLEPTTSVVIGILIFHEAVSLRTLIGAALVILASLLIAVFDIKASQKSIESKE